MNGLLGFILALLGLIGVAQRGTSPTAKNTPYLGLRFPEKGSTALRKYAWVIAAAGAVLLVTSLLLG